MDAMDMVKANHIRGLLASGAREDGREFYKLQGHKDDARAAAPTPRGRRRCTWETRGCWPG